MAAEQCVKNEELVQLNSKDKETLDELVKAAERELTEDTKKQAARLACEHQATDLGRSDVAQLSLVRTVAGVLKTFTKGALNLHDQHRYGGYYLKNPPTTLDGMGSFVMTDLFSVSGGVVYTGKNKDGKDCGWLLAGVNANGGIKVYAECGPKSKFDNVNWDQVKTNLESRGRSLYLCTDPTTNTKVYITIQGADAQYVVAAALSG